MKGFGKRILTGLLTALCALCLLLTACGGGDGVTFKFETNGAPAIEAVTIEEGTEYELPTPEWTGHVFEGWYADSAFTGTPVISVTAEEDKTFYAKWTALSAVTLDLAGGTLEAGTTLYLKAGEDLYTFMQAYSPTRADHEFGGWFAGETELARSTPMPEAGITLTARYKVGYTIEVYKQTLAQSGYEHTAADDITGYEYAGTQLTFTASTAPAVQGFAWAENPAAVTQKTLTETAADNVFRLYFDRVAYAVSFFPGEAQGDPVSRSALFGSEVELPAAEDGWTADGMFLYAWEVQCGGNAKTYETNAIENLVENGDGTVAPVKFTVEGETFVTALWSKGYVDMMSGEDVIYLFHEDDEVCYLDRCGKFFKGEHSPRTHAVTFRDASDNILMQGRIKEDGTFIYAQESRQDLPASYYEVGKEIDDSVTLIFDSYDGVTYYNGNSSSEGSYTIDENNNYHITFTEGDLSGQERVARLLVTTVSGSSKMIFQFRNEEEYAMPLLQRVFVDTRSGTGALGSFRDDYYSLDLDGFGNASMNLGTTTSSYFYILEGDTLTLLNSNGSTYGVCRLMTTDTVITYIPYNADMDTTYTAADGSTLTLDGIAEAKYEPKSGASVEGYYTTSSSVFGSTIVTIWRAGKRHVFLVKATTVEGDEGEESVTTYSFETRPDGYAEYYYDNGSSSPFYAPLIVMNETAGGRASVYGYTSQREYIKVAEGAVTENRGAQTYALAVDSDLPYPDAVSRTPVDLEGIRAIVFGLGTVDLSSGSYPVSYWYSVTKEGADPATTDLQRTYTGTYTTDTASRQLTLTVVGGFAVLQEEEEALKIGACSTQDGVTTVNIEFDGRTQFYVELHDDGTFLFLTQLLGSARERNADGTSNADVTFEFDGKGNATLVTAGRDGAEETRLEGTVEEERDVENVEGVVFRFTPKESGTEGFRFILLSAQNATYFTRETAGYAGSYAGAGSSTLELDGFGFRAKYTLTGGKMIEGIYSIVEENIVRVVTDSELYFFDITERTFAVRGSEYGDYVFVDNYAYDGYTLHLDGHGAAILTYTETENSAEGTYTEQNGTFTLTFGEAPAERHFEGRLGYLQVSSSSTLNAFLVQYSDAQNVYVDADNEWTVLRLDGFGNARRYLNYGAAENGTYILIADTLLYYANTAGTDACIYRYDAFSGVIEKREYEAKGYYTSGLDALLFSEYGFMVFNGETRYYYDIDGEEHVTIYRRAFGEEGANEYGFLTIPIGKLEQQMNFGDVGESFGSETYYSANGYGINFKRADADKLGTTYKYPLALSNEEGAPLYPLMGLTFAPVGSKSYSTTAQININGQNRTGTIYRTVTGEEDPVAELYLVYNGYRFDLEVNYEGAENATYSITKMRRIATFRSNMYMDMYVMILLMLGSQVPDTIGTLSFIVEYHEDGTAGTAAEGMDYITSDFGEDSVLAGFKLDKANYTLDETTHIYTIVLPKKEAEEGEEPDPYEYRVNLGLMYNQYYAMLGSSVAGYTIFGYTRVEELTAEGDDGTLYTVTAERVLASEASGVHIGDFYSVVLETGEEGAKEEVSCALRLEQPGKMYLVSYTYDGADETKITAATYYELVFTERDGGSVEEDTVKYFESVTVRRIESTVYYTAAGSYAEVLPGEDGAAGTIAHFYYARDYAVTECTYDAASQTYTVTTSENRQFAIAVTDPAAHTITITELSAQS